MTDRPELPDVGRMSVLDAHGGRRYVYPADARGRWSRLKPIVYFVLIAIYVSLPFIEIGGNPAVWINLPERHFYLFGATFNAQDFYLAFFVFTGIGFTLIVLAALFGRVWCGWACPQTVFLDGVFRRIERWIEGPAERRRRAASEPMSLETVVRKSVKHAIYVILALVIAHVFLAYFTSADQLGRMIVEGPGEHPGTFTWAVVLTLIIYGNFWWFREQLCIVICPYGRLQSSLQDQDTINVIYDHVRGEPRGKAAKKPAAASPFNILQPAPAAPVGDCVACNRCVAVCPTGIDIRQGHQLECIGCAYCIDACDEIMVKLDRPKGLIRYDSERAVETKQRRFWRPRLFFYVVAGLVGLVVATVVISQADAFEAEVMRSSGSPFTVVDGALENQLRVHVVNKHGKRATFHLEAAPEDAAFITLPQPDVTLDAFADHALPVLVRIPGDAWAQGKKVHLVITHSLVAEPRRLEIQVLGPHRIVKAPAHHGEERGDDHRDKRDDDHRDKRDDDHESPK